MIRLHTYLTFPEWSDKNDWGMKHGYYNTDPRLFTPGTVWECPWVYDPTGYFEGTDVRVMIKANEKGKLGYLSRHYWNDWADIRPPLKCMSPTGEQFELDRRSTQTDWGWKVTKTGPDRLDITCSPSFVLTNWHGWLQDRVLSADCEGRDANAFYKDYIKRLDKDRPVDIDVEYQPTQTIV